MRLSRGIPELKRLAKRLSRTASITHTAALDHVARAEGFASWSALAAAWRRSQGTPGNARPGQLLLIGARPFEGKTRFCVQRCIDALDSGRPEFLFSLQATRSDIERQFERLGRSQTAHHNRFFFDGSEHINANYICARLGAAPSGCTVAIDYLQVLDQRRVDPDLETQVRQLRDLAQRRAATIHVIAQVSRSWEDANRPVPGLQDIRLPNPLDLRMFDQALFLAGGAVANREAPRAGS